MQGCKEKPSGGPWERLLRPNKRKLCENKGSAWLFPFENSVWGQVAEDVAAFLGSEEDEKKTVGEASFFELIPEALACGIFNKSRLVVFIF